MEITLREWQEKFKEGAFDAPDFRTQCNAGWYDWFCADSSLANKTKRLGKIVSKIHEDGRLDIDKCYVWFKNNCPMVGPLYDDIRISDMKTGENIIVISIDDKRSAAKYEVTILQPDVVFGTDHTDGKWKSVFFDDARYLVKWLNGDETTVYNYREDRWRK